MDPHDAFTIARGIFDRELADLVGSSASASSPTATFQLNAEILSMIQQQADVATPVKRPAQSPEYSTGKKQKLDLSPESVTPYSPPVDIKLELDVKTPSPMAAKVMSEGTAGVGGLGIPTSPESNGRRREGEHSRHVHASRRVLLDRPDATRMREAIPSSNLSGLSPTSSLVEGHNSPSESNSSSAFATTRAATPENLDRDSRKTWKTQRNAVRRQWDARKSDMAYEDLLELRRNEKVANVDRYVPSYDQATPAPCKARPVRAFPFTRLPDKVRTRIFELLLVSNESIRIDFTWLRSFVNGHTRMPSATQNITSGDVTYHIPVTWNKVIADVVQMQNDMRPFRFALEERAAKTRKDRAPCRALTTGLLWVSKSVYEEAARVFYSGNTFWFPWPTSAWMQLESFLATIGAVNTSHLRKLRIHAPLWHRGPQEDFAEGAILDLTSPASRFAVMKPPARDRLLTAIQSSVKQLSRFGSVNMTTALTQLTLDLEHGDMTDLWANRCSSQTCLISISEAEEFTARKRQGIEVLHNLARGMIKKPLLYVYTAGKVNNLEIRNLRETLPSLRVEATKYGWEVDGMLRQRRMY